MKAARFKCAQCARNSRVEQTLSGISSNSNQRQRRQPPSTAPRVRKFVCARHPRSHCFMRSTHRSRRAPQPTQAYCIFEQAYRLQAMRCAALGTATYVAMCRACIYRWLRGGVCTRAARKTIPTCRKHRVECSHRRRCVWQRVCVFCVLRVYVAASRHAHHQHKRPHNGLGNVSVFIHTHSPRVHARVIPCHYWLGIIDFFVGASESSSFVLLAGIRTHTHDTRRSVRRRLFSHQKIAEGSCVACAFSATFRTAHVHK